MPSFVIVGYVWQILGRMRVFLPSSPIICEQPMSILNRVKVIAARKARGQENSRILRNSTTSHKLSLYQNTTKQLQKLASSFSRSSHRRCSTKKVLWNISQYSEESNKVAGFQTCNFVKKRPPQRFFLVNIAKFLRTPTLKNICERMLLIFLYFSLFLAFYFDSECMK